MLDNYQHLLNLPLDERYQIAMMLLNSININDFQEKLEDPEYTLQLQDDRKYNQRLLEINQHIQTHIDECNTYFYYEYPTFSGDLSDLNNIDLDTLIEYEQKLSDFVTEMNAAYRCSKPQLDKQEIDKIQKCLDAFDMSYPDYCGHKKDRANQYLYLTNLRTWLYCNISDLTGKVIRYQRIDYIVHYVNLKKYEIVIKDNDDDMFIVGLWEVEQIIG
jgi:hypothetical protein